MRHLCESGLREKPYEPFGRRTEVSPAGRPSDPTMPVEERGLRCGGMPKGCKPAGVASAYNPALQGREEGVRRHHMQKRRSRADRWWEARCRQGVNRPGGASERSTAGEAVQLLKAGGTQNLRSRCDRHGWKRLRTGVPCARRMLPLESRMREIRTSRFGEQGVETDL